MKTMDELYKQCKKLHIFIFNKKNKKIKNLKKQQKKSVLVPPFIHTTYRYKRIQKTYNIYRNEENYLIFVHFMEINGL